MIVEARAQNAHALVAILDLRFLVLATDHGIGGKVRNAHRGIGRVHRLPAGPRRAERIDADILGLDLHVHVLGLRQHGNRHRRGVHAALRLRSGNPLHAMHAALPLHLRVDAFALDDRDHFLVAAHAGLGERKQLDLPPVLLGKARDTCGKSPRQTAKPRRRLYRRESPESRSSRRWDPSAAASPSALLREPPRAAQAWQSLPRPWRESRHRSLQASPARRQALAAPASTRGTSPPESQSRAAIWLSSDIFRGR